MTETYTLVGYDPSWIVALMPVPALAVLLAKGRRTSTLLRQKWTYLAIVAAFLVSSLIGLPSEWIYAGACLVMAVYLALMSRAKIPESKLRWTLACFFVGIGVVFAGMTPIGFPQTIVLTEQSATENWSLDTTTAARKGMTVTMTGLHRPWFNIRPWASWSFESGQSLSPGIAGFDLFWGPHGLIRGDDLGKHVADWAGVTPKGQSR